MMMNFKKMFVGKMFAPKSDCHTCQFWGKDKTLERHQPVSRAGGQRWLYSVGGIVRKQFEQWYCDKYWNFKGVENRQVFFDVVKNSYNNLDIDLAYNAFISGTETLRKLAITHLRAVADAEMDIAGHKHCCEPSICYACRSDGINTVATHIENYREI